jgi:phosphatidylserine synthase
MNKKNISFILAGVILLILQFNIKIGSATIDVCSDIIAYILIIIGIMPLTKRNIMFKKSRNVSFVGLVAAIGCQAVSFIDWGDTTSTVTTTVSALSTIFTIYFTYYFSEAIILEAKFQDKSATTRSLRVTWALFGVFIFVHYIAFMSNVSIAALIVQAVVAICGIYYCSQILTACNQLYMEGLPTKRMDTGSINTKKK